MTKEAWSSLVIIIYLILHIPAIIASIIGLFQLKSNPKRAKKLFIFTGIYFLVGSIGYWILLNNISE
ncbi:MAG: hypothetical protein GY827_10935 [Cytophagales bacterium]|nr:hypothetical protein [Cytophagales bacterium]